MTSKLRNHFYREISEKDSPPPPEIEPIPSNSITNREAQAAPDPVTTTQQGIQNVATAQPSKVGHVKDLAYHLFSLIFPLILLLSLVVGLCLSYHCTLIFPFCHGLSA